jgi:radical SAM superfamily enzyme YgiQ (UPF0313 family)
MRIAFISANREKMPDAVIPIGVLQVMAAVPERHEKLFWDLCFEDDPLAAVARNLRDHAPDLVAIGLRNIQNMDYTNITVNLDYHRRLVDTVRTHTSAPIVLGGGGFSVIPRELMESLGADYGIAGEGERAFARLLDELERPTPSLDDIERLHYRVDGTLRSNGSAREPLDIDELPRAGRSVLPERYYTEYGIESLQTKRGCPLHCEYCTYPLIEGARSRMRDPARVADEFMAISARRGVEHVFIVDSVFNLPPRHAKAVCRELVARGNRTPWTSYVNPVAFDDELAELMVRAGAAGMEIGSDSGCDEVLDRLRKGFHTDKIRRLSAISRAHGLKDCHSFILGTKGETLDDVERTLDFAEDLDPFAALMLVWVEDQEVVDARTERERRGFRDEIYTRVGRRAARQPRWSVPRLGIRFDPRSFAALRKFGLRGPLWQHLDRAPTFTAATADTGPGDAAIAAPVTSA